MPTLIKPTVADVFLKSSALLSGILKLKKIAEPIIDIHQHTHYHGRTDETMLKHQRAMGVTTTILLPARMNRPSTHAGKSNGLAAKTGGNATVDRDEHPFLLAPMKYPTCPACKRSWRNSYRRGGDRRTEIRRGLRFNTCGPWRRRWQRIRRARAATFSIWPIQSWD